MDLFLDMSLPHQTSPSQCDSCACRIGGYQRSRWEEGNISRRFVTQKNISHQHLSEFNFSHAIVETSLDVSLFQCGFDGACCALEEATAEIIVESGPWDVCVIRQTLESLTLDERDVSDGLD